MPKPREPYRRPSDRRQRPAPGLLPLRMLAGVVLLLAPLVAVGAGSPLAVAAANPPTLTTDKPDYAPGETVHITGTGFAAGVAYDIPVIRPDGSIVKGDGNFNPDLTYTCPGGAAECWDTVTAGSDGSLTYDYILDGISGTYEVRAYASPWTGDRSLPPLATATFTDGNVGFHGATGAPSSWTVNYTTYNQNQTCSGTGSAGSQTISGTGQATQGIGNGSLKLGAVSSADPSLVFSYWTKDSENGTVVANNACFSAPGGNVVDLWAHFVAANQAPMVTASPVSGTEGSAATEIASFTDANTADTHSCTIDWGDGNTTAGTVSESSGSGTCTGSHSYADNGAYTVTVTVSDGSLLGSDTDTATINNVAPVVSAGADDTINEGATFSGGGSFTDPGADTWSATVDYGDGSGVNSLALVAKTFSLSHLYADNGAYTVTVCVTDDDGGSNCDSLLVTVNNVAPVVSAGADDTINEGATFSGGGSFTDPGADTWSATVDYGDGSGVNSLALVAKTFSLSHLYADNGAYTVTVCVTDDDGGSNCDSLLVTVNNVAPVVSAGADDTINEGATFSGGGSFTDPGADTWSATVDYGDGSGVNSLALVAKTFSLSHLYADNGAYTVTVCVTDDDGGSNCDSLLVTVNNVAPVVSAGADDTINEGATFSGGGSFTDPGADTWSATVDYGDGSGVNSLALVAKTFSLSHLYADNGAYTVTVCVTDDDGGSNCDSLLVTVNNVAPVVSAGADDTINEGATFSGGGSFTDPGADTWSATVDYGDGSGVNSLALVAKTFSLSHLYADNGAYTVTVCVTDDDGGSNCDSLLVTVNNVAPVVSAGADDTINEGATFSGGGSFTDPGADTWSATVDYGDGSGVNSLALVAKTFSLSHLYADNGAYTVTVCVTDDDGGSNCDSLLVTVNNVAPVVSAGADDTINEGATFSGGGSFTDPGADTWSATVDYGDGSGVNSLALVAKTFSLSHLYADNGAYTVTVCVTDDDGGSNCDSLLVTVNNVAPTITGASASPDPVYTGFNTSVSGSFTDPGVLDTHAGTVDWGDGTLPQALTIAGSNTNGTFFEPAPRVRALGYIRRRGLYYRQGRRKDVHDLPCDRALERRLPKRNVRYEQLLRFARQPVPLGGRRLRDPQAEGQHDRRDEPRPVLRAHPGRQCKRCHSDDPDQRDLAIYRESADELRHPGCQSGALLPAARGVVQLDRGRMHQDRWYRLRIGLYSERACRSHRLGHDPPRLRRQGPEGLLDAGPSVRLRRDVDRWTVDRAGERVDRRSPQEGDDRLRLRHRCRRQPDQCRHGDPVQLVGRRLGDLHHGR